MLLEEYRPKTLDDVKGQDMNIQIIKGFVENNDVPHMLFHGPAAEMEVLTTIPCSMQPIPLEPMIYLPVVFP